MVIFNNVVSMLPKAEKIYVENENVVSSLSDVVQINVEKDNVDSTLFNVINFNVDIHDVVSTLIWRCTTSQSHINLNKTLKRRWNICWVHECLNTVKVHRALVWLYKHCSKIILWFFESSRKIAKMKPRNMG